MHCWFPAYDPDLRKWSPGLQMFVELARAAAERGISRIDLGKGPERFKTRLSSGAIPVAEGTVDLNPAKKFLRQGWYRAVNLARSSPLRRPLKSMVRAICPSWRLAAFR